MAYEDKADDQEAQTPAEDAGMPPDPWAALVSGCEQLFRWHMAMQGAGFSPSEALYLTGMAVQQAMRGSAL